MLRRRIRAYSEPADLPPTHVLTWSVVLAAFLVAIVGWTLGVLSWGLLGPAPRDDLAVGAVRVAVAAGVPIGLLIATVYAVWRVRLEWLAHRPGPILVFPFVDRAADALVPPAGAGAEPLETARSEALRAAFQRGLLETKLASSTAIPSPGRATDFLGVVENAGASVEGVGGALFKLIRLVLPTAAYEVRCALVDPAPEPAGGPCVLVVELTRAPRAVLAPETITAPTWETAAAEAAEWVAANVLPRTRRCVEPPWTLWSGLRLPPPLFSLYQRFQALRADRRFDEAMSALHDAMERDPANLALRLEKGKLEEQMGMHLDALETYDSIIGHAARRDRRLAYLRFGPPPPRSPGAVGQPPAPDRSWHDGRRRAPGLEPEHPVVYVARYRHALLLGLGEELAAQWWCDAGACREHRSARHATRDRLRRTLSARVGATYRDPAARLADSTPAAVRSDLADFLHPDGSAGAADREERRSDARVFFTSMGVWEVEHLITERLSGGLDAIRFRAQRTVLPRRSLQLILPRAILRKALAMQAVPGVTDDERRDLVASAGHSMLFPIDEPVVNPDLIGLLDAGRPDFDVLAAAVDRIMAPRRGALRSWHEHYNVACAFSILLMGAADPDQPREAAVAAAITELQKAVACGDSGFLASRSDWILSEDPDLDGLRSTADFRDFEADTFGIYRGAVQRGPQLVDWCRQAYVDQFVHAVAGRWAWAWAERIDLGGAEDESWPATDREAWRLVGDLALDHEDWRVRHRVATGMAALLGAPGVVPRRHPAFSDEVLRGQVASLRGEPAPLTGPGGLGYPQEDVRADIDVAVTRSIDRLAELRAALWVDPGPCGCPRGQRRWTPVGPARASAYRDRWAALAHWFDDGAHPPAADPQWLAGRSAAFRSAIGRPPS